MKNLTLQSVSIVDVDLGPAAGDDDPISHFCLDNAEGLLYAATRSGLVLCLDQGGKQLLWSVPLFDEPHPPFSPDGSTPAPLVVAFIFVLELDAVFIACSSGELLLLHIASHKVEEVGLVSGGLAAAAWSPDGELLVLLGHNQLLLMMNKEWEVLAEVTLPGPAVTAAADEHADSSSGSQLLLSATLTWRGDSKYFATNTLWAASSSSSGSGCTAAGAASSSSGGGACRLLHIWDREECQLHATAQAAAGLSGPIAWQPNSRHLYVAAGMAQQDSLLPAAATAGCDGRGQPLKAAPHQQPGVPSWPAVEAAAAAAAAAGGAQQRKQQQQQQQQASSVMHAAGGSWLQHVLLYERNGLQHGGFDVPTYSQTDSADASSGGGSSGGLVIHALHWSSDSELLAVVLAPAGAGQQGAAGSAGEGSATHEWHVQLWHRSNWHWYLKHEQLSSLPDAAGSLLLAWDESLPGRLHMMAGSGSYSVLDLQWDVAISSRGTAVVIDGHVLLITPLRHGQVPPPMCAVRAVLPRPANAVAWLDGDVAADLDAPVAATETAAATDQQGQQGSVDVVQQGLCEVLAVLLSDGQVVFLRAVESDLWEESLEDQAALGGPAGYLLPLGYCPASSDTCSTISSTTGSTAAAGKDFLSMSAGPWNPLDGSSTSSAPTSRPGQQPQQPLQQHQQQQHQLLPMRAAAAQGPFIPLAEGRLVSSLVWIGRSSLLLLAAPFPAEEGLEQGEGTVLVEVSVRIPSELVITAGAAGGSDWGFQAGPEPETAVLRVSYAGGHVLAAAPHPAGGALLHLQYGPALYYSAYGQLLQLQGQAAFGAPCRTIRVLPNAPAGAGTAAAAQLRAAAAAATSAGRGGSQHVAAVASLAPALGLTAHGALYWGSKLIATDVTSFAVRGGGPGGPAVLYVTRQALLYAVMVSQLPTYVHTLPDESTAAVSYRPSDYPGDLRAAISRAMRPGGAAAAARDPHVRAVEQGAMVLAAPWGDVGVVLQMQRGNLEGISPRLLVLAAICDALEQQHYARAWQLAVTHRVDLNLIVDYAWPRFVQHAAQFVAAVGDPSELCDLLFALQPGSVLQQGAVYGSLCQMLGWQQQQQQQAGLQVGLQAAAAGAAAAGLAPVAAAQAAGAATGESDSTAAAADGSNKVSAVCAAVRQAVLQLPGRFLQGYLKAVVISYARTAPPSLEAALIAVREVKEASVNASRAAAAPASTATADAAAAAVAAAVAVNPQEAACPADLGSAADAALRHLLLYVDVDQLYRTALGLYDLPLAFMVVGHSQKDPGEYLAELTSFGSQQDEQLRRHAIDMSLGRYDKALSHLVAAGPVHFEAALKLARERGALRQLLALTQQQQQQQQDQGSGLSTQQRLVAVLSAYGDWLLQARKPEDAAVAYSAAGLTEQALGAYKAANAWRMCMVLSARLQQSQAQQHALARELAEQLQASGSGAEAAQLLAQYLGDVDGAVAALVAAKEWREALRVAYAAGRQDLVDTTVVPGAAQAAASLLEEATESTERISKYSARLREVCSRRLALEAALAAAEAEAAGQAGPDNDDLASDAGASLISGLSVYTERTGADKTALGSSVASSSRAPSTIGGRKALRHEKKAAAKGKKGKIRAGSPGEEAALAEHLATLAPPKHALEEAGQLAELLVMLRHVGDAAKLQQCVGQWQAAAAAAMEEVTRGQKQRKQQQEQPSQLGQPAAGAVGAQPGQHRQAEAGGAAAGGSKAAADEVRWKWDVLREHK